MLFKHDSPRLATHSFISLCLLALSMVDVSATFGQDQLWIRQFGTSAADGAFDVASDGAGGALVAGTTHGDLGGPNAGGEDAYVARYDRFGNQLWLRQFGTGADDNGFGLAPDSASGAFVAGATKGSLGGPFAGERDAFLARYDDAGNQLWLQQLGTSEDEAASPMTPDGAGGVFVAGVTRGELVGPNAGLDDIFLAHYDDAGNQAWIIQFGTERNDWPYALAPDGAGGVFVGGARGIFFSRDFDVFLARFDGDGNRLWMIEFGSTGDDWAFALASDGAGGVMIAGSSNGDLGGPTPRVGETDAFVARYDGAGARLWMRQFGTRSYDRALGMAPDGVGGVVVAGHTTGSLGGPFAGGSDDVFLAGYDSAGNQSWVRQLGSSGEEWAYAIAPDGMGGVMVAGRTDGILGGSGAGGDDAFLARLGDLGCYHADCDQSTGAGVLDLFDFLCFQNSFVLGEPYACDCDTSTGPLVCDLFDFLCFQGAFVGGCP